MEAHALVAGMPGVLQQQQQQQNQQQQQQQQNQHQLPGQMVFPALLLLVSGGHNMLVSRVGFLGQVLGLWFGHHHPKNNCNIVTHFCNTTASIIVIDTPHTRTAAHYCCSLLPLTTTAAHYYCCCCCCGDRCGVKVSADTQ
jgi:hypothetical protein